MAAQLRQQRAAVAVARLAQLPFVAAALAAATLRDTVGRQALIAFRVADALWVVGSALVLVLFWGQLAPIARFLVIAVALVVELFAALQYRAAGLAARGGLETA